MPLFIFLTRLFMERHPCVVHWLLEHLSIWDSLHFKKKSMKIITLLSFCENSDMMYLRPGSMLQDSTLIDLFRGDWRSKLCRLHLWQFWKCNQFNKFMCRVYIWLQGKPACDVQPIFTIIENMDVFDIPNWFHHTVTRIGCFHKFHLQKEIP